MMNHKRFLAVSATIACLMPFANVASAADSSFFYQGRLQDGGATVDGLVDVQFRLFDAATGGAQIGSTLTATDVDVLDGLLTSDLDFGANAFDGGDRWLQISVRNPAGGGAYSTLSPRQEMKAAPMAWVSMRPWQKSNENYYISLPFSSGGVGVGTSLPQTRFHVAAAGGFPSEAMRVSDFFNRSQLRIATPE